MHEQLQSTHDKDRSYEQLMAQGIGASALVEVGMAYGKGMDEAGRHSAMPPLERDLAYHNTQHSWQVYTDALRIAADYGMTEYDMAIVGMAAQAHDVIQEGGRGEMELKSAHWLDRRMEEAGFPEADREAAFLAVLGTQPLFDQRGVMIGQRATQLYYPSERARQIAYVVASADMAGLYSARGPLNSLRLYQELQGVPAYVEPAMDGFTAFQELQLVLMDTYRFPLEKAARRFERLKQPVIAHQQALLEALQSGRVSTWGQVSAMHRKFLEENLYL